ncbi:MAG: hypothetical protein KatS3mg057_2724 [Herpetosiphonaceae bacterium]|nr:MAG: hypothetical protein KatS3mg057_2724 [Herpetosiphonaceae bacterium]
MLRRLYPRNLPASAIVGTLGIMFVLKALSGGLALYIHPRYTTLVLICGLLLVVAGLLLLALPPLPLSGPMLVLPAIVLVLALLVPARPLGANLVPNKGLAPGGSNALIARWQAERPSDTRVWTLLEWTAAIRQQGAASLVGKPVSLKGFIYRDETLGPDEVYVARYVVTCCTADGTALSLRVKAPGAASFSTDQWVQVDGVFALVEIDGQQIPRVDGTLTPIETPRSPYLYP